MDDFATKPLDVAHLSAVLDRWLHGAAPATDAPAPDAPAPGDDAAPIAAALDQLADDLGGDGAREVVDLFLKYGRVEDAEEYMQIRRQLFEENGYHIRKLNQAYFAFHGAYGTGAAATSPIGPKLQRLRELSPDLRTFLETVRWFTSEAHLDKALAQLEKH